VLTALYAASPPGTGIQFHLFASPDIRAPLARYAGLRRPDEDVPEFASLGRAGRHSNIHRTMARRRVEHYLAGSRARCCPRRIICSGISGWWSVFRLRATPRISRTSTICCWSRQRARHLARGGLSVESMDGSRSHQLGVRADRSAPADRRLSCPPLRRWARAARSGHRPGDPYADPADRYRARQPRRARAPASCGCFPCAPCRRASRCGTWAA
jgi:hypothetical protein